MDIMLTQMILLRSKTFKNHQKLLENFVHFWVSLGIIDDMWKKFSILSKPLYDLLKAANNSVEIKAPNKEKNNKTTRN